MVGKEPLQTVTPVLSYEILHVVGICTEYESVSLGYGVIKTHQNLAPSVAFQAGLGAGRGPSSSPASERIFDACDQWCA